MSDLDKSSPLRCHITLLPSRQSAYLRFTLILSLAALLVTSPLNFARVTQSVHAYSDDAQAALSRKSDKMLKRVYRTARAKSIGGNAAQSADDVDAEIEQLSRVAGVRRKPNGKLTVGLTVRLANDSVAPLRNAGFRIGARIGDVATVEVEAERLPELAALPAVRKMSAAVYRYPTNDRARQAVKVDNTAAQRIVSQTGRGVVVGIVDSGIDFRHADFLVPNSSPPRTRIKALWDMSDSRGDYTLSDPTIRNGIVRLGHLFTEADINAALQGTGTVEHKDLNGHGTHVAGIAAGSGLAGPTPGLYAGIAPEADLVIVKATRSTDDGGGFRNDDLISAMLFVKQQAAASGKPFVINMSLGGHAGPHDGTNDDERAIDNLVNEAPGRAVCVAAGNEGDEAIHAGGNVPAGGEIELKLDAPSTSPKFLDLYYSNADRFSVTVTRPDGVQIGPVAFTENFVNGAGSDPYIKVYNATDPQNGKHDIYITFTDSAKDLGTTWTFKVLGDDVRSGGRFDAWIGDGSFTTYVDNSRKVSSPGTSQGAITVGAYVSRSVRLEIGSAAPFTNAGPTADGRQKPDISAPGYFLYSAKSADSSFGSGNPVDNDSFHSGAAGTSMATPVVAGGVALLLQANPGLASDQIKEFLKNTADHDGFTGPSGWNDRFGFGKFNITAALLAAGAAPPPPPASTNSIDGSRYFVRQHYLDFLAREPETAGSDAWVNILNQCGAGDTSCDRIEVSASFFRSEEFQIKGYFVYRFYKVSLERLPGYQEFVPDLARATGQTPEERDLRKQAFTDDWVTRPEFRAKYDGTSNTTYVDQLLSTAGVVLASRAALISDLDQGRKTRAQVLRTIVESPEVYNKEYNGAFVAMQYFGYLRRDPETDGYNAWLRVINGNPADYRTMVWGFVTSVEYRKRFGQP
ncbi:MAG: S8 family serine peptidase [Pyrinomonadaceae bacterium]|nr:S8 family serine peptidase [Pyrinomonadaceae bacterium]